MPRLTKRKLDAMSSALAAILAGEIDEDDELQHEDYKAAQEWVWAQLRKRERQD